MIWFTTLHAHSSNLRETKLSNMTGMFQTSFQKVTAD